MTAFDKGDDKAQPIEKECHNKEFKYYSFYEVIGYGGKDDVVPETESDLFNEFWARYWS